MDKNNVPALKIVKSLEATKQSDFIKIIHNYIKEKMRTHDIDFSNTQSEILKYNRLTKPLKRMKVLMLMKMIAVENIPMQNNTTLR